MRGRRAGHHRDLPRAAARTGRAHGQDVPPVIADFDDSLPVLPAELDVIEFFLSGALRELFTTDSATPQIHADIDQPAQ